MNGRSRTSPRKTCSVATRPPPWRFSGASVSPSIAQAASSSSAPMPARTTKIPRQSVTCSSSPPTSGARIGARPPTSMSRAKMRAAVDALVQVAHDRARDDDPGRAGHALDEAEDEQQPDGRGSGAQQRGRHVGGHAREQRAPAPERVADRAGHELPAGEPQHRGGDRQLRRPRGRGQVAGHRRQPGQVHVHRQRPEGRQRAEEQHEPAMREEARRACHRPGR